MVKKYVTKGFFSPQHNFLVFSATLFPVCSLLMES